MGSGYGLKENHGRGGAMNWIKDTDDIKPEWYELANSRMIKPICNIILITL
jgi:hypothetical protein